MFACVSVLFLMVMRQSLLIRQTTYSYQPMDVINWKAVAKEKERKINACVWGDEHDWMIDYVGRTVCKKCGRGSNPRLDEQLLQKKRDYYDPKGFALQMKSSRTEK